MSTFVLVPGAWHGSWCWKRVRKALQAQGHEVFTPTFTGVGERSHLLSPQVDLETHIADVANLVLWEELNDFVLCGHSYGGAVITAIADRMPERVRALVYLDAFILEDGQSVHDVLPPAVREAQLQGARETGDGWRVPPISAEDFGVNARDRGWMNRQCTPHPLATFEQRLKVGRTFAPERVTYVLATGYSISPFPPFYERAKAKGWKTVSVPCGHDVMLDRPTDLIKILLEAATARPT